MATVGLSLDVFCRGLLAELSAQGYEVVALTSTDRELEALGRREKVRTIGVKMARNISPLSDLRSLWQLYRVLRRERPDIIHTMTPKAGLLGMLAAWAARVPVRIHTFTGLLFPTAKGLKQKILKTTDRLTCMAATHIIPEGEGVKNDLISARITSKPMGVLGHGNVRGIDLAHYSLSPYITLQARELRERFGISPDERVLVFIGRFVGDKGLRELLTAIKGKQCHLIMVGATEGGSDDLPADLLRPSETVHYSDGWVDDVRPWLAMADALVFPSYREGFPNVVLEAGAMRLPSIVTDINGSREIITEGQNGFIVSPRDTEALAVAIDKLLSLSPGELAAMGENARKNVEQNFSQPYVRACLKEFYRKVTASVIG